MSDVGRVAEVARVRPGPGETNEGEASVKRTTVIVGLLGTVLAPSPAWAYTDPGTGALLLQLLFGGIGGLAVVLKLYWRAIKTRVARLVQRSKTTDTV
jgi:hypothetical protein